MPLSRVNGVEIAWDRHGDESASGDRAIVLVQGLGMPSAAWPQEFISRLVAGGFGVITFDNRDVGSSEILGGLRDAAVVQSAVRRMFRLPVSVPYRLSDMAADTLALIDELGLGVPHVVGFSMGGMIAQRLALSAPDRLASLTSVMSTTNDRNLPQPSLSLQWFLASGGRVTTPRQRREHLRRFWKRIGSPGFPRSEDETEAFIDRIMAAGMPPAGRDRQTLAIIAEEGRGEDLAELDLPAHVIHGTDDPLVPVECGKHTAQSIPGATLELIEGMGHDLPAALVPLISDSILAHVKAVRKGEKQTERAA